MYMNYTEPTRERKLEILMESIELWDDSQPVTRKEAEMVLAEIGRRGLTWADVQTMPEIDFDIEILEQVLL